MTERGWTIAIIALAILVWIVFVGGILLVARHYT